MTLTYKGFVIQHLLGVDQHMAFVDTLYAYSKLTDENAQEEKKTKKE
jgi:hypothetical protein